ISQACAAINGIDPKRLYDALLKQAKKKTAIADLELDEDGKAVKDKGDADEEGVIIVEPAAGAATRGDLGDIPVGPSSRAEAAALKVHSLRGGDEPALIDVKGPSRLDR